MRLLQTHGGDIFVFGTVKNLKNVFFKAKHSGTTLIKYYNLNMLASKLDVGPNFERS
jgi:hypothetical protein